MMRSQASAANQEPGNEQKKSVFDRLGRSMNRRSSPGHYGEYMPPPPPPPPMMHEPEFGRYGKEMISRTDLDRRHLSERRHVGPFLERHPGQMVPSPMGPQPPPPMYEMELANRQPYYPHPHMYQGPPSQPVPMGAGNMPMAMHQRRPSPKYDRHGNPITTFKDRPMRMGAEHHQPMSPPRNFMHLVGSPMMHFGPQEMPHMRYPPQRWHDNLDDLNPYNGKMIQDPSFGPFDSNPNRFQYQQQSMLNNAHPMPNPDHDAPRYTKWRERRDVITSLDRETTQSSHKTDSLRSSLQQPESKSSNKNKDTKTKEVVTVKKETTAQQKSTPPNKEPQNAQENEESVKASVKTEHQDISDGEIIDDEDTSDDESLAATKPVKRMAELTHEENYLAKNAASPYQRSRDPHSFYATNKKRRMLEREDYFMDYETISDEDLDDFMVDKKMSDIAGDDDTKSGEGNIDGNNKTNSEIELLNALGLDWAHLVEMAKQSKNPSKESTSRSAVSRFSCQNYLPTLGITPELAGPEIYEFIQSIC